MSDDVLAICTDQLDQLVNDFSQRFKDLEEMDFPGWLTQYSLVSLDSVESQYRDELAELQNDASAAVIHNSLRQLMWLSNRGLKMLLPFPTSYLVESGFSSVADLLTKKRGTLDIVRRGDLLLKLTKLVPNIKELANVHQAQGSH